MNHLDIFYFSEPSHSCSSHQEIKLYLYSCHLKSKESHISVFIIRITETRIFFFFRFCCDHYKCNRLIPHLDNLRASREAAFMNLRLLSGGETPRQTILACLFHIS